MKLKILVTALTVMIALSACTVQEKMNPIIFTERFSAVMNDEITIEESFSDNGRFIVFFSSKNGDRYVCELLTDNSDNIKKVCLASNNANKAESFDYIFRKILNVYAPNENTEEIIPNLFKNKWNFYTSQWYRYSCIKSDENIFASIESVKLSTQSDAELTLKQSDIIYP